MYAQVLLDMIVESWSTNEDAGTKLILSEKQLNYGKEKLAFIDTLGVTTIDDDVAIVRQDLSKPNGSGSGLAKALAPHQVGDGRYPLDSTRFIHRTGGHGEVSHWL